MKRTLLVGLAAAAMVACGDSPTAPLTGDNPSAILGEYSIDALNGRTHVGIDTLDKSGSPILLFGDATIWLYANGTYHYSQLTYDVVVGGTTKSTPAVGTGQYALHGTTIEFVANTGVAPETATIPNAGGLRLLQSIRSGRKADTLTFKRILAL